jgi:hypothetical protein
MIEIYMRRGPLVLQSLDADSYCRFMPPTTFVGSTRYVMAPCRQIGISRAGM